MNYNVAQLLKESLGSTRTYRTDQPSHTGDGTSQVFPYGLVCLMRTDKGIWVSAALEVPLELTCSRCTSGSSHRLKIAIEEEYLPTVDILTGQRLAVPETAEGCFTIDRQHVLDLRDAVKEYIITNQPMKPLCRQNCRGLCPTCGANRNECPCSCQEQAIDPRWRPVLRFLEGTGRQAQSGLNLKGAHYGRITS